MPRVVESSEETVRHSSRGEWSVRSGIASILGESNVDGCAIVDARVQTRYNKALSRWTQEVGVA